MTELVVAIELEAKFTEANSHRAFPLSRDEFMFAAYAELLYELARAEGTA